MVAWRRSGSAYSGNYNQMRDDLPAELESETLSAAVCAGLSTPRGGQSIDSFLLCLSSLVVEM